MDKFKIAIVGIGNCASSLIQGIYYYKDKERPDWLPDEITPAEKQALEEEELIERLYGGRGRREV